MLLLPDCGPGNTPFRTQLRVPTPCNGHRVWMADSCGGRPSHASGTIKYGGTLFQADDARARVNFQLTAGGHCLETTIAGFTDEQRVALADPWPHQDLAGTAVTTVIGRRFLAPTDTAFDLSGLKGGNCVLDVTIFNDEVAVGFATDGAREQEVWSGPVVRYGWEFVPQVWPGTGCTLIPFTFWKDEIIVCGQTATPDELMPQPSATNDPPWAGYAGAHPTTRHSAAVDRVLHAANHYSH
jgi:hypothetical protein